MAIEVFNRYEHKYIIDENTFCKVLKIINEHMITDFVAYGARRVLYYKKGFFACKQYYKNCKRYFFAERSDTQNRNQRGRKRR